MIVVVTQGRLRHGASEAFRVAVKAFIEASRNDEGNISYDLFEAVDDSDRIMFIARWEDELAFKRHNASKHMKKVLPALLRYLRIATMRENKYKQAL
jgi:quinol monooxygenase YgiN